MKFNKEIEIIEKNQIKIQELKNTTNEMKTAIECIIISLDQTEDTAMSKKGPLKLSSHMRTKKKE